jgi:peptidoglycan/xylan/chitin deacetylase (PgdA/CDA1 family)
MIGVRNSTFRGAYEALYFSGLSRLLRPSLGGVGSVLTLHHVRPARTDRFQPNRFLEITPDFLDAAILRLRGAGFDLVSMDELCRRLTMRDFKRPFVAITLDDGYRDNRTFAFPVFRAHNVPFAIFIATSFADRRGQLWWSALEQIVAANDSIIVRIDGEDRRLACGSVAEKYAAYLTVRDWLAARPSETAMLDVVRDLTRRYSVDMEAICAALCMHWQEIVELAADPLVTIGAHTVNHIALGRADAATVRYELETSRAVIKTKLGRDVDHFAYPYGDALSAGPREYALASELGFKSAVTTRPSVLFPADRERLTALPRLTLSGEFQRGRYLDVLVSGAATALWNTLRRRA